MENENVTPAPSWEEPEAKVVSVKDWVLTIFIYALPLVGIIMLFVWAFESGGNPNKANWAKAMLFWLAIGIVLAIFFLIVFGSILFAAANEFGQF